MRAIIELCRMAPIMIIFIPFVIAGLSQDTTWFLLGLGSIMNFICIGVLKLICGSLLKDYSFIYRPEGAIQCSDFINCGATKPSTTIGMPSGHSQSIGFLVGYMVYRNLYLNKENLSIIQRINGNKGSLFICGLLLFTVMYSRLGNNILSADIAGCHTFLQTVIGATLGLIIGFNYHRWINPHTF